MAKTNNNVVSHAMTAERRIKLSFVSGFLFVIIIGIMLWFGQQRNTQPLNASLMRADERTSFSTEDVVKYEGREGVDALTLLQEILPVEQDNSGLVVSINGRRANSAKREFWSFFVNGHMAPVGPADYITKNGDQIEWKIQTY